MDVEVNTGREGTWRSTATDDVGRGGAGMEVQVVPLEMYDSARAKIAANLRWLFGKAFGPDHIPTDLQDPFYTDQYEQEHIKPPIIRLLLSSELYCSVCGLILQPEHAASLQSHQSVIQALSRKGVFVLEDNTLVSELDLSSAPIKMSSHIHLIDALMMVYTLEMISIQKVVSSVKRFANVSDSKELPFDLEEAMVFWINKVNVTISKITQKELKMKQHLLESPSHQKVRYRRDHSFGRSYPHFPLLDNLSNYVCNGTALLAVIHFYCPELIRLEDICLKDVSSVADTLYNIQLLLEFSNEFLKCFYLRPEDMLYSPPVLKNNVVVFIAELFWIFEVVKPDFVQPRGLQEIKDVRLLLQPKSSRPHLPFSNATKRNFLTSSNQADTIATPPSPPSSKTTTNASLLPLRQKQKKGIKDNILEFSEQRNRSSSVTLGYGRQLGTAFAWPERRQRPLSQTVPYALHFPSGEDADSISLSRSISKDSLATNFMSTTPKHMLGAGHSRRLSGHSLLDHIRFEDEEEELEEEELVAVIHPSTLPRHQHQSEMKQNDLPNAPSASGVSSCPFPTDHSTNSYYLEPLMPAIPKPAKEKSVSINKEEECGESDFRGTFTARKIPVAATCDSGAVQKKTLASESIEQTCSPKPVVKSALKAPIQGSVGTCQLDSKKLSHGFFLHLSEGPNGQNPFSSLAAGNDSDSDIEDLEEDTEDQLELSGDLISRSQGSCFKAGQGNFGEGESAKLGEDLKVSERDDKEDLSGCSSPCLSTVSWPSSCSTSGSTSVKMTSFAEKKLLKLGLRNEFSSTSSSLKTTPDGLEAAPFPPWQLKKGGSSCSIDNEPCSVSRKDMVVNSPVGPSELLEIHMQLEEQRRAIEFQKKRMETFSSQQRLKLGKAAFLNIVKKEARKSDTLPLPLKHTSSELTAAGGGKVKTQSCKDDSCLEALKMKARDNRLSQDTGTESDLSKCSHSVELLNAAITSIQQQMMQLSLQQDMLFKHSAMSAPESTRLQTDISTTPNPASTEYATSESTAFVVNFVDINDSTSVPARRPPKLSSSQYKASDRKQNNTAILERSNGGKEKGEVAESCKTEQSIVGRVHDDINQHCARDETGHSPIKTQTAVISSNSAAREEESSVGDSVKEAAGGDESTRMKAQLIEVDLSEIREPLEDGNAEADSAEGEQKNALGFFFKEDEKADEMEKRRAAFLLKLQRKAEEAKLRKQQQDVDSELKRDEARRKAEEERIRKEEEKARRELIKQEYLRKKQQTLMEEQGLVKPRPRIKSRNSRPKSIHREDSKGLSKGSNTPDLSCSYRGSTLSLATDAESVIAVEAESQRAESVCSMESFPVLSRTSSRNLERDWENGSIASSITSTEYTGPKLFKEPSSKSNKPIIINAIAHCCLAGKVNETQKNVILEVLDKCDSNHLFILFRDGGCQFRAIYSYSPDNEEIIKITGTGPRNISQKMIDKLFKYSSDRKLFAVIHTKTVSVSVDALTIHNHLWHVRRPGSARRK